MKYTKFFCVVIVSIFYCGSIISSEYNLHIDGGLDPLSVGFSVDGASTTRLFGLGAGLCLVGYGTKLITKGAVANSESQSQQLRKRKQNSETQCDSADLEKGLKKDSPPSKMSTVK